MPQVQSFKTIYKSIFDAMDLRDRAVGYVTKNLTPTANAAGTLVVSVSSGEYIKNSDAAVTSYAGGTVTLTAADPTNPRVDLVYFSSLAVLTQASGTAAASSPVPVAWPAGACPVAICFVPAGATDFTTGGYVGDTRFFKLPTGGTPTVGLASVAAAGTAQTFVRTDANIIAFDNTNPASIPLGGGVVSGTTSFAARSNHGHDQPFIGCRVFNSASLTIASVNNWACVTFNSERYDTDPASMHSSAASTAKIKFRTPGYYMVGCNITQVSNGSQSLTRIILNGTTVIAVNHVGNTGGQATHQCFNTAYNFVSTDSIQVEVLGGTSTIVVDKNANWSPEAWAHKIG